MLKNYIKIAWKVLRKKKLYTGVILFNMVLTLTILNIILSFTNHFWGNTTVQKKFDRVLAIEDLKLSNSKSPHNFRSSLSYDFIKKYIKKLKTPEKIGVITMPFAAENIFVYKNKRRYKLKMRYCNGEYWDILDFSFIEGRPFNKGDIDADNNIAVIDEKTRQIWFNGEKCVGQAMLIHNVPYKIVGVVKNVDRMKLAGYSNIWIPDIHAKNITVNYFGGPFEVLLMAKNQSGLKKIKNEVNRLIKKIDFPNPSSFDRIELSADPYFMDLMKQIVGEKGNTKRILSNISIIFLIIYFMLPVINLINVNTNRIFERAEEIGIRKSFGATISTVTNQFIIENMFVTLIALLLSIFLSFLILTAINFSGIIPDTYLGIEWSVVYKSFIWSLLFGLFSSAFPAFRIAKIKVIESLNAE